MTRILSRKECQSIVSLIRQGISIPKIAEKYGINTGDIDLITSGSYELEDGSLLDPKSYENRTSRRTNSAATEEEIDEICECYAWGDSRKEIRDKFHVSEDTLRRYIESRGLKMNYGAFASYLRKNENRKLREFLQAIRYKLWSTDRKEYDQWKRRKNELFQVGSMREEEAYVAAAKEFPMLKEVFDTYNYSKWDSSLVCTPDDKAKQLMEEREIKIEGRELSYRENVAWALNAIGVYKRTTMGPATCPNDSAYWLYLQALNDPKSFLDKVNSMEMKVMSSSTKEQSKELAQRSMEEIEDMLEELAISES